MKMLTHGSQITKATSWWSYQKDMSKKSPYNLEKFSEFSSSATYFNYLVSRAFLFKSYPLLGIISTGPWPTERVDNELLMFNSLDCVKISPKKLQKDLLIIKTYPSIMFNSFTTKVTWSFFYYYFFSSESTSIIEWSFTRSILFEIPC